MRLGTENTREIAILAIMVLIALFTTSRWLRGGTSTQSVAVAPAPARPATQVVSRHGRARKPVETAHNLDPTLRFDLLRNSEDREYTFTQRNIFRPHVEEVVIPKPSCNGSAKDCGNLAKGPTLPPQPPVNPGPPPIDLKFFGFATSAGSAKKIFLASGEDVFIAGEGEIVNRRYRVVHIQPNSVEIEDVLNNNKQTIPLTQG